MSEKQARGARHEARGNEKDPSLITHNPSPADAAAAATVRVAYHAGPPEIGFYGREWIRDVAQWIPTTDWIAMNNRADIGEFAFREEY